MLFAAGHCQGRWSVSVNPAFRNAWVVPLTWASQMALGINPPSNLKMSLERMPTHHEWPKVDPEKSWKLFLLFRTGEALEVRGFVWKLWHGEYNMAQITADTHSVTGRPAKHWKTASFWSVSQIWYRGWTLLSFTRPTGHWRDQIVSFCLRKSDHWPQLALKALSSVCHSLTCPERAVTEGALKHQNDLETWCLVMKGLKF